MSKILIAEDEINLRQIIIDYLEMEGHEVTATKNGKEALECFQEEQDDFDLVLLDVMMPFFDGFTVAKEIRKTSFVPIIFMTARDQEVDELYGFEIGADDYVKKPFKPSILMARVATQLRRKGAASTTSYGRVSLDRKARQVKVAGQAVMLSPKEYDLLETFVDHLHQALSRDQLLDLVWGYDYYGDLRTVDTHIKRLRNKLGVAGEQIVTVRGLGYRFEEGRE